MKILYLDCFLGIDTEMLLGALINLGADASSVEEQLKKVFPSASIKVSDVKRCALDALKAEVILDSKEVFGYSNALEYTDININDSAAAIYLKRVFKTYFDADSVAVIKENEICGIYALYLALKSIDADYVISSVIREGSGFYEKDGGYFIIPSPAALEIFKTEKIPVRTAELEVELTGALGASVLSATANEYGTMPEMNIERIGYGAGSIDLQMPNLIRVVLGSTAGEEFGKMFESADLFAEISEEIFV